MTAPVERAAAAPSPELGVMGPPWSSNVERLLDGSVAVAGVDVADLAARFGTPLYVLDEVDLRARARGFRAAFQRAFAEVGAEVDVYYAGKAFLSVAVARWVRDEGLAVDVSTGGELAVALAAGVPGARIGLHGNNKSDDEIAAAIDAGVGRFVADSLVEAGDSATSATAGVDVAFLEASGWTSALPKAREWSAAARFIHDPDPDRRSPGQPSRPRSG